MLHLPGLTFDHGEDIEMSLSEITAHEEECKRLLAERQGAAAK